MTEVVTMQPNERIDRKLRLVLAGAIAALVLIEACAVAYYRFEPAGQAMLEQSRFLNLRSPPPLATNVPGDAPPR